MKRQIVCMTAAAVLLFPCISRADFKYTESTKFTGGAMAGLVKFAARVGGKGEGSDSSTYYIKGSRMRVEGSDGEIQIIDLDTRQVTSIDSKKKTYGIITFAEMAAQMEQLKQFRGQKSQASISPKLQVNATQNTRTLLGHTAHEIQATVELQSSAANSDGSASTVIQNDSWVASTVPGYEEVKKFHEHMAQELNWAPGGGIAGDPRIKEAMQAMQKSSPLLNGFPLLRFIKMTGSVSNTHRAHSSASVEDIPTSVPTSKSEAANEALGGLLGLHRRKQNSKDQNSSSGDSPESAGHVLMTATTEVTTFSNSSLESSLFEIPAGYRQTQEQ